MLDSEISTNLELAYVHVCGWNILDMDTETETQTNKQKKQQNYAGGSIVFHCT